MKKSTIPPLRPIALSKQPFNHRALAWSSDAELAIAADDSVTIYLPTFPILDPTRPLELDGANDNAPNPSSSSANPPRPGDRIDLGNGMGILPANLPENNGDDVLGDDDEADDSDDNSDGEGTKEANDARQQQLKAEARERQFSEDGARVLCVAYPALHPELNLHVWEAAGKAMPVIRSVAVATAAAADEVAVVDGDGDAIMDEADAAVDREKDQAGSENDGEAVGDGDDGIADGVEKQPKPKVAKQPPKRSPPSPPEIIAHPGAGTGVIAGAGSSLNHVVAVEWSPAGLGRNLRPVLAVLTGCGSLAVYGEGGLLPFGSTAKSFRMLEGGNGFARDLQSWLALWAVGENFVLPGQEEYGYGEFVKAFAWSAPLGMGKALLGYMNDLREIVVLCVGTTFQKTAEGLDEATWNVQEITRMETGGPHEPVDPGDPDYIPSQSSFCLRWGPWAKGTKTWSCLLSYMDRNYVGFKKLTINAPTWNPKEAPILSYKPLDWDGLCAHLTTDAFLEFENKIWEVNGKLLCRGVVATPSLAKPFEIDLSKPAGAKASHSTDLCKTTFPRQAVHNPITGLVIHSIPEDMTAPPPTPLYTAVRLSATATNPKWWESNNRVPIPQWVNDINAKITRLVPYGKAIHEGDRTAETAADGDDGIILPDAENDENSASDDDDDDDSPEPKPKDLDAHFDPWANEGPDVHPHNMRLWGLALSPGGGSSAVLATQMLTQRPMRGTWAAYRSRVMFSHEDVQQPKKEQQNEAMGRPVAGLSIEGRMWEWLHGGGPGVAGLTPPSLRSSHDKTHRKGAQIDPRLASPTAQAALDIAAAAVRTRAHEIFVPFAAAQRCEICDTVSELKPVKAEGSESGRVRDAECPRGHRYAVCGVTGMAILAPGISRACGVCGCRCLLVEWLLERVLIPAGREKEAKWVSEEMVREVCGRCGGKFLD